MQRITITLENERKLAERYYTCISYTNGLNLSRKEIKLLAYIATSEIRDKESFRRENLTSVQYIYNMTRKLKNKGLLVKDGKTIKVNPKIRPDFNKDVTLEIILRNGKAD